jgi:hypothetical protein
VLLALQAHKGLGELAGRSAAPVDKLFGVLTSLGNVAFAYNSCVVMIEIQVSPFAAAAAATTAAAHISAGLTTVAATSPEKGPPKFTYKPVACQPQVHSWHLSF